MVSNSRRGFSLLELVFVFVAVAVVGIVLALTTTDVLESNEQRRAEGYANEVLVVAQGFAQRYGGFSGYPGDYGRFEDFDVVTGPSDGPEEVSVALGESGTLGVAVRRSDDTCVMWRATDLAAGGGSKRISVPRTAACDGVEALGAEPVAGASATTSRAGA